MAASLTLAAFMIFFTVCGHCNGVEATPAVYVVYMGEVSTPEPVEQHKTMLREALGSEKAATESLLHSFGRSFDGFVARLSEDQMRKIERMEGVVSVFKNTRLKLHTTRSWDFIGLPISSPRSALESELVIGMIDSGVWPESESFSDVGLPPLISSKFKGSCEGGDNFTCNNKIVGARYYHIDGPIPAGQIPSPRDNDGHGSHTTSTAAGALVYGANLYGLAAGIARGGVPSARIAVYKACWENLICAAADLFAAFHDAIADGVDIISISAGLTELVDFFEDPIAVGSFHAMKSGILTSSSAGNEGPSPRTMENNFPWLLTVAASTIDRKFVNRVVLGDGRTFEGVSVDTFDMEESHPLVMGCNIDGMDVHDAIILCFEGLNNLQLIAAVAKGAVGLIRAGDKGRDVAMLVTIPISYLRLADASIVSDYIQRTSNPKATILKSTEAKENLSPFVASFSSRGPNRLTRDIIKPDLAAPGVDILAAWSEGTGVTKLPIDKRIVPYNIDYGTSMACPHVSAAAAMVKSFNPTWSPAAIRSALMTTASPMSSEINPDAEFAYGSGQIDPLKAISPGLVYDMGVEDYVEFLCGQGLTDSQLRRITGDNTSDCAVSGEILVQDLNYPSFSLSGASGSYVSSVFHRTVTNVGFPWSTYRARVTAPPGLSVQVQPDTLSFIALGESQSFVVVADAIVTDEVVSASIVWEDAVHQVRSPLVVWTLT